MFLHTDFSLLRDALLNLIGDTQQLSKHYEVSVWHQNKSLRKQMKYLFGRENQWRLYRKRLKDET